MMSANTRCAWSRVKACHVGQEGIYRLTCAMPDRADCCRVRRGVRTDAIRHCRVLPRRPWGRTPRVVASWCPCSLSRWTALHDAPRCGRGAGERHSANTRDLILSHCAHHSRINPGPPYRSMGSHRHGSACAPRRAWQRDEGRVKEDRGCGPVWPRRSCHIRPPPLRSSRGA